MNIQQTIVECLKYTILKEDLFITKFPYTKVLQADYNIKIASFIAAGGFDRNSSPARKEFSYFIRDLLKDKQYIRLTPIEDINSCIYLKVEHIRSKYPTEFKAKLGWFEQRQLVELYLADKLQLKKLIEISTKS